MRLPCSQRLSLLLKSLENDNVRFLSSRSIEQSEEVEELAIDELISIIAKYSIQHNNYPVLSNIFKLKKQDFRRSAVYALGRIGKEITRRIKFRKGSESEYLQETAKNLQAKREITKTLTIIINNRNEDISLRWVAAASLQEMDVNVDNFFVENDLANPKTARWKFPPGDTPWEFKRYGRFVTGIIFDIYSGDLFYDNSSAGCGAGLGEIYNTLRNLLNLNKK
jgi:hypothetical protein